MTHRHGSTFLAVVALAGSLCLPLRADQRDIDKWTSQLQHRDSRKRLEAVGRLAGAGPAGHVVLVPLLGGTDQDLAARIADLLPAATLASAARDHPDRLARTLAANALIRRALTAATPSARREAAGVITDERTLARLAGDASDDIAMDAVSRITDQAILRSLVVSGPSRVRRLALDRITDQATLRDIAASNVPQFFAVSAAERLTLSPALNDLAYSAQRRLVKVTAVLMLGPEVSRLTVEGPRADPTVAKVAALAAKHGVRQPLSKWVDALGSTAPAGDKANELLDLLGDEAASVEAWALAHADPSVAAAAAARLERRGDAARPR